MTEKGLKVQLLESIKEANKEWNVRVDEISDWMTRLEDAISVTKEYE